MLKQACKTNLLEISKRSKAVLEHYDKMNRVGTVVKNKMKYMADIKAMESI